MYRSKKFILIGSISLITLVLLAISLYSLIIKNQSTKYNEEESFDITLKKDTAADIVGQNFFIAATGEKVMLGIYHDTTSNTKTKKVSIYGTLKSFNKAGGKYELSLKTYTSEGESLDIIVDMGKSNDAITNLISDRESYFESPDFLREGDQTNTIKEVYSRSDIASVYNLYKNNINVPFRIDIYVSLPAKNVEKCDEACVSIYQRFSAYEKINNDLNMPYNNMKVGSPALISRSY